MPRSDEGKRAILQAEAWGGWVQVCMPWVRIVGIMGWLVSPPSGLERLPGPIVSIMVAGPDFLHGPVANYQHHWTGIAFSSLASGGV